jgi:tetratricopeptide (TPR) repeat protein
MKKLIGLTLCCAAVVAAGAEKPVTLYPGLGIWKHPIATKSPEAQKYFDQGLVLLYGFNRYEALRSFRKALELDPKAGMAQWGVVMAQGPYLNMDLDSGYKLKESCEDAAKGLRMDGISSEDRAWIAATATRCPDFSDPSKYIGAMRAITAQFPDDPDAQTWYAEALMVAVRWKWYGNDGKPAEGVEEAERVLQGVLRRYPNHPGANHFYIHAVESSPTPERAVPSAQKLMGIVPAAGHIVHMPGHIWLVLGDYNAAVDVNERGAQVDREYFAKTGVMGDYYMYYLHNLQFILYARSMQGRIADTKKAMADMQEASKPMAKMMPEMADVFDMLVEMTAIRTGQWEALLAQARPKSEAPPTQGMWHFARAVSLMAKGQKNQAIAERQEFEKLRSAFDRKIPWGNNNLGDVMDLASAILEARTEESVPKWRRAVEIQDRLVYDEPPAWYYPVRESLGAALLLSGDDAGAEATFREGLRRSPNNGRMLFGLLESLKAQKKTDAAAWVEREFQTAWKGADMPLKLRDL